MKRGLDWDAFVRRHWEKTPARLPLKQSVLSPEQVFRGVISVCEPFRHGMRFRTLPDVRLFVEDAQLAGPGALLPGVDDAAPDTYVRRAAQGLGGSRLQLFIEQPFMLDFPLWNALRSFLRGLLERVGMPVLPVVSELLLGNFQRSARGVAKRPDHALLTLVLQGRLRVRLWEKLWGEAPGETTGFDQHLAEATTLEASAGELLYTPSRYWQLEEAPEGCMAVRLWIPVKGSRPTDAVKDVLVSLLESRLPHDEAVPYLPFPWRKPRKGGRTSVALLEQTADALHALTREQDVHQALRIIWARRVSACALEPVPAPDRVTPLRDSHRVRGVPSSHIVRMQAGPGSWIWAVNGHAFPGPGASTAQRLLQALASGEAHGVGELCGLARRGPPRDELRGVLARLQQLRALQVVSAEEG